VLGLECRLLHFSPFLIYSSAQLSGGIFFVVAPLVTMEPALAWSLSVVSRPQYLRPSRRHMRVFEYVPLEKYDYWRLEGEKMVRLSVSVRQSVRICVFVVGLLCCERRGESFKTFVRSMEYGPNRFVCFRICCSTRDTGRFLACFLCKSSLSLQ
jgi:hypothetical protein